MLLQLQRLTPLGPTPLTMKKPPKIPPQHELDQHNAAVANVLVPHYGAVFRAFCKEDGVSRREALELTIAYMQRPPYERDEGAE